MKPDDDFKTEFDPLLVCVYFAALLGIVGLGLFLYEVVRALFGEWA